MFKNELKCDLRNVLNFHLKKNYLSILMRHENLFLQRCVYFWLKIVSTPVSLIN